jgi:hypothetical protein
VLGNLRRADNRIRQDSILMQKPLRCDKSLGEIETESGIFEVVATAEATYDKATGAVVVSLNSFLRLEKAKRACVHPFADSILGRRTVTVDVAEEQCAEAVDSIFANWVHGLEQTGALRLVGYRGKCNSRIASDNEALVNSSVSG